MRFLWPAFLVLLIGAVHFHFCATLKAEDPVALARSTEALFNGWGLTPAGQPVKIGAVSLKVVISPDGTRALTCSAGGSPGLAVVDLAKREQTQWVPLERAFNGLCLSQDGKHVFVGGGNSSKIYCFAYQGGAVTLEKAVALTADKVENEKGRKGSTPVGEFIAGITTHPESGDLYICSQAKDEIWVVSTKALLDAEPAAGGSLIKTTIRVGQRPYSCLFGADNRHLYVSNWGARTVSVIDTQRQQVVRTINVGIRPNDMALSPDGRLFVACAGDNSVYAIQTRKLASSPRPTDQSAPPDESALEIISTALYPQSPEGSTPVGVAVSTDGQALFAVNADNNDVMVADISDRKLGKVVGFIPTGWYPTAVAFHNNQLLVANGKGLASRANFPARLPNPAVIGGTPFDYALRMFEGSLSFIDLPDAATTAKYTQQVLRNSPYTPECFRTVARAPTDNVIPARVGGESPIKYVVYIIKENRTYDQVYGDFKDVHGKPAGNSEPKLTLFGEDVTPNQHQLARDYVLLDNFYCNGEVSVDGHSWCDGAIATDANQKGWIISYSHHGHLPTNKELDNPAAGYLWDHCQRHGISFKCYGEGSSSVPTANRGTWPKGRDTDKVAGWIADLHEAEKADQFPAFTIMSLGENHTQGTTPGKPTPAAAVASNDLAVGQLVEAASKSKFWKQMAIFIVEDDAQNGPDHVDSHRTAALVVSPYVKRGIVDSTPYTQVSMVRTIQLILGLPPMTQYDGGATPMYNSFQRTCAPVAYTARQPRVDLSAVNAPNAPGAKASAAMNFEDYDDAPEDELNRILWLAVKGPNEPYPTPVRRATFDW